MARASQRTAAWHLQRAQYWAERAEQRGVERAMFSSPGELPKGMAPATFATMHAQIAIAMSTVRTPVSSR